MISERSISSGRCSRRRCTMHFGSGTRISASVTGPDRAPSRRSTRATHHGGQAIVRLVAPVRRQDGGPLWRRPATGGPSGPVGAPRVHAFLDALETTPMTRSYKMMVLLAMLNEDRLPGTITIDDLARTFTQLARRSARLQEDVGAALDDPRLRRLTRGESDRRLVRRQGDPGVAYFAYEADRFSSRFDAPCLTVRSSRNLCASSSSGVLPSIFNGSRGPMTPLCARSATRRPRPILFLPDRAARPDIPVGATPVLIDGQQYEAEFAKIAVNVIRAHGSPRNELPGLLRAWFGPDAGLPGTSFQVRVERAADNVYQLVPLRHQTAPAHGPEAWRQYPREAIPPLFGLAYSAPVWNQGFIFKNNSCNPPRHARQVHPGERASLRGPLRSPRPISVAEPEQAAPRGRHRAEAGPTRRARHSRPPLRAQDIEG